jgi:acetyl-CoA carboxylase carboxyltransferase component
MSWSAEVEEMKRRRAAALAMGGAKNVKRQHDAGRLTVRERFAKLLDSGSFEEIGSLSGSAKYGPEGETLEFSANNILWGRGRIEKRPVVVSGDDFTMRGGTFEAGNGDKMRHPEIYAADYKLPLIRLVEGSGGGGSVATDDESARPHMPGGPRTAAYSYLMAEAMANVPVVSLGLGPIAGLGVARMAASHYSLMTRDTSFMFIAGPPVVARTGQGKISKEELGSTAIHIASGAVDDVVESEDEAFARTRRFLSYLPTSVDELPARTTSSDDPERREEALLSIVPRDRRKIYAMRKIIESVFDQGSFFEVVRGFGKSVISGFARLDGWPVAVLAEDPKFYGGAWTAAAAQKIVRFVDMARQFHLPVVHLVDCPGFEIGLRAEQTGTLRHATRAVFAINQFTGPWCSIIVRNVFGLAGAAHQPQPRFKYRYAWPSARSGSLPLEGGIEAAYKARIEAAADPQAELAAIQRRLEAIQSPLRTAEAYDIEDVIDPRETRPLLCRFANDTARLRKPGVSTWTIRP